MIHEIKIKNFLSFKDEVTFSFEATKDTNLEDYYVREVAGLRLLRLGVVYGANASGKSNLLNAFEFLKLFCMRRTKDKKDLTEAIPFLLDKKTSNKPSEFSISFILEGKRYLYSLVLDSNIVYLERLYIYPKTKPALIFKRTFNNNVSEISFNSKIKLSQIAKDEISIKCLPNMSVFAAYSQVNVSVDEIDTVIEWFTHKHLREIKPSISILGYAQELMTKDQSAKSFILDMLKKADFNISNIDSEVIEERISDELLNQIVLGNKNIPNLEIERLKKEKTIKLSNLEFEHKILNSKNESEYYKLPKEFQSQGTMRTFELSAALYRLINNNSFLAIDEIESSLHPQLIAFLLEEFLKQDGESQLLVSTHYDGLLEEIGLLRNDSIWFTEKQENGSTSLYSLNDFTGLSRISSLQKAYKFGKFGGIPNIE